MTPWTVDPNTCGQCGEAIDWGSDHYLNSDGYEYHEGCYP